MPPPFGHMWIPSGRLGAQTLNGGAASGADPRRSELRQAWAAGRGEERSDGTERLGSHCHPRAPVRFSQTLLCLLVMPHITAFAEGSEALTAAILPGHEKASCKSQESSVPQAKAL